MNNEKTILDAFERGKAFGFAEGMKSMRVDAVNISKECVDKTQNNRHEPVAWMNKEANVFAQHEEGAKNFGCTIPLYTHPVKELTLTEDEIDDVWAACSTGESDTIDMHLFAEAILKKAQEK